MKNIMGKHKNVDNSPEGLIRENYNQEVTFQLLINSLPGREEQRCSLRRKTRTGGAGTWK